MKTNTVIRFEALCRAHLDAAYDLARWLARDPHDAEDVVQEASLRAFKSIDTFRGGNARAWLLTIVRNTFYTWYRRKRAEAPSVSFDENADSHEPADAQHPGVPADWLLEQVDARQLLNGALERLPEQFREVIVLRELEDLSYAQIASVAAIPIGTVMSRLARARRLLRAAISARAACLSGGRGSPCRQP